MDKGKRTEFSKAVRKIVKLQPRGPRSQNKEREGGRDTQKSGAGGAFWDLEWVFTFVKFYLNL